MILQTFLESVFVGISDICILPGFFLTIIYFISTYKKNK